MDASIAPLVLSYIQTMHQGKRHGSAKHVQKVSICLIQFTIIIVVGRFRNFHGFLAVNGGKELKVVCA